MKPELVTTAEAAIQWAGERPYEPPYLRYAPSLYVANCAELDMRNACWTASVRKIEAENLGERIFLVTFQIPAPNAPHHLLTPEMDFEFREGPDICVWRGNISRTFMAPKDASFWYDE